MAKQRFGVSVPEETGDKLEELVEECADLGATRSEIIAAVLVAYLQSNDDEIARIRELLKQYRTENNG
jgi:metal-responsive CopG/Arc/MetJ family transcriptional regulator